MERLLKNIVRLFFPAAVFLFLTNQPALALDSTWSLTAINDQWTEPANWVGGIVPNLEFDSATIPGGAAYYPVLNAENAFLGDLTIQDGGSVSVGDSAGLEISGLLTINSGGTLTISGNSVSVYIFSGNVSGTLVVNPLLPALEAVITLASTFSIGGGGNFQLNSGGRLIVLPGSAALTIGDGGTFWLNGGNVSIENDTGGLIVATGGLFQMDGGGIDVGTTILPVNPGALTWEGLFEMSAGRIQVSPGSSINSNGGLSWSGGYIQCSDSNSGFIWTNLGTITLFSGEGAFLSNCNFTNDNQFTLASGASLVISDQSTSGVTRFVNGPNGTIDGSGRIEFTPSTPSTDNIRLVNNGILAPGGFGTVGGIEIFGEFDNIGIFKVDVSGSGGDILTANSGSGASGSVLLSGELVVESIAGSYFDGQTFPFIDYQLQSNTFTTFTPTPPDGYAFDPIDYGPGSSPGSVTLTLRSTGPVAAEWDGSESSDWFNAQNWVGNAVPTEGNDILIPVVTIPAVYPIYPASGAPVSYGIVTVEGEMTVDSGADFRSSFFIGDSGKLINQGNISVITDSANNGLLVWTAGNIGLGEGTYFTNSGLIECDTPTAGTDLVFNGGPASKLINQGTFIKTGAGGAVLSFPTFEQEGILEVTGGTLYLGPGVPYPTSGRYAGEFQLANNAEVILGRGDHFFPPPESGPPDGKSIIGSGRLLIGDPNVTEPSDFPMVYIYNDLILDPGISLEVFSGTVAVGQPPGSTPHTVTGGGQLVLDDATSGATPPAMYLYSDLTVEGPVRIAGGGIDGEGDLVVNGPFVWTDGRLAGASLNGNPGVFLESAATIDNSYMGTLDGTGSTLRLDGRDLILIGGATVYDGRLEFGRSARIHIGDMNAIGSPATLNVQNDLALGMTFAPDESNPGAVYGLSNHGTIAGSGRLAFAPSVNGIYPAPDFSNSEAIAPGNGTAGALVFDVDTYNHFEGELQVNLQGAASGEWDRMDISGDVSLAGILAVDLDFTPLSGDEFVVMAHGGISGDSEFSSTLLKIGGIHTEPFTDYFNVLYETNQVKLRYKGQTNALSTISVSVSPSAEAGIVEGIVSDGEGTAQTLTCPDSCSGTYPQGTAVSLVAIPSSDYTFVRWEYPTAAASYVSESANTAFVSMDTDVPITAVFAPAANTATLGIAISPPGSGTVTGQAMTTIIDPETGEPLPGEDFTFTCPEECSITVPGGSSISLSADPSSGYRFSGWQGADSVTGASAYVQMISNRQVSASFYRPSSPPVDDDDTPVIADNCPDDPLKTDPGICGCGVPDIDSDGDGIYDCNDGCPEDPEKTEPGVCGCGIPDTDSDQDSTPDCVDSCPEDPKKTEPGICGCGILDIDSDGDGIPDCQDGCAGDPEKSEPGFCGCGVPETGDRDGDGIPDCNDLCPDDPEKTAPGSCGCGIPDADSDGDGIPDCLDPDEPVNPNLPPLIPGQPQAIAPEDGVFLDTEDVTLEGLIFLSGDSDQGLETHWWIRSADKRCEFQDIHQRTYGGIVKYKPTGLRSGLRYVWRFGYRDPTTEQMVWTETREFTIGTPVELPGPIIEPGTTLAEYANRSFFSWSVKQDIVHLLEDFIDTYDTRFFRIGRWNPEAGEYVEFAEPGVLVPEALKLVPGRGFWFLAREGLFSVIEGVPVTLTDDINVNLGFDNRRAEGWNQIGVPNDADYAWGDVELTAFEPTDDPEAFIRSFGPVPLSQLAPNNPYIHLELWRYVEGSYIDLMPGEADAVLLRNEGYWVRAKRGNICLVFRRAAQKNISEEDTILVRTLRKARRFADYHLGAKKAIAQSGDTPPMPMGSLNPDSDTDTDSGRGGGAGACFIKGLMP